jgi:hypothetical protein
MMDNALDDDGCAPEKALNEMMMSSRKSTE